MRACLLLVGLVVSLQTASAFPYVGKKADRLIVKDVRHADAALSAAIQHLSNRVLADDRPFIRFFWWGGSPDRRVVEDLTNFRAYLNKVNSETEIAKPFPIEGTNFRLWGVDIRDTRWTIAGFAAVAHRDHIFTEPNCDHTLAETIRRLIGVQQDVATFHVEAIVPGPWLLWQIMSPGESQTTTYYDLLYSVERFGADKGVKAVIPVPIATVLPAEPQKPQLRPWPGGVWQGEDSEKGKNFAPGAFDYIPRAEQDAYEKAHAEWLKLQKSSFAKQRVDGVLPPGSPVNTKPIKDFPEDLKQYQDRWGTTANADFLNQQKLFVNKGEVVAGGKSDPKRGSYVAYQDRVIRFGNGEFNNGGLAMSSQDFLRTSGRKNPANLLKEVALGELEEDAGEHLTHMPNGLTADMLTGAAKDGRKRIENADARVAHSTLDPRDVIVWNVGSCVICHAREDSVLAPSNRKVGETLDRGIEAFIYGKENQLIVRGFFKKADYRLEQGRMAHRQALMEATAWASVPPWTGSQWAEATVSFAGWYNEPVYLSQFAAELGYPKVVVMYALLKEGSIDAGNMFIGEGVARTIVEDDLAPRLLLILAALRDIENPDPIIAVFYSDLLRQAEEKVGKTKEQPTRKPAGK